MCFFVVLFDGHEICTGKDSKKIISYLTSNFHTWFYDLQSHPQPLLWAEMSNPLSHASSLPLLVPMEEAELHTYFKIWGSHRFVWGHNDILLRKFKRAVSFIDGCWMPTSRFHGPASYIHRASLLSCTDQLSICTSLPASILL